MASERVELGTLNTGDRFMWCGTLFELTGDDPDDDDHLPVRYVGGGGGLMPTGVLVEAAGCAIRSPNQPEPPPVPSSEPAAWDLVLADIAERDAMGTAKYGQRLTPGDGRNSLVDAYQEALDLVVYLRKHIHEERIATRASAPEDRSERDPSQELLDEITELKAARDRLCKGLVTLGVPHMRACGVADGVVTLKAADVVGGERHGWLAACAELRSYDDEFVDSIIGDVEAKAPAEPGDTPSGSEPTPLPEGVPKGWHASTDDQGVTLSRPCGEHHDACGWTESEGFWVDMWDGELPVACRAWVYAWASRRLAALARAEASDGQ